jgi:hypothetical protein
LPFASYFQYLIYRPLSMRRYEKMFPENEVTQARRRLHEAIVQDLRQENPDSYMALAVKHGVTTKTIYNIARANGVQRKDRRQEVANGSQTL